MERTPLDFTTLATALDTNERARRAEADRIKEDKATEEKNILVNLQEVKAGFEDLGNALYNANPQFGFSVTDEIDEKRRVAISLTVGRVLIGTINANEDGGQVVPPLVMAMGAQGGQPTITEPFPDMRGEWGETGATMLRDYLAQAATELHRVFAAT